MPSGAQIWEADGQRFVLRMDPAVARRCDPGLLLGRKGTWTGESAIIVAACEAIEPDLAGQLSRKHGGLVPVGLFRRESAHEEPSAADIDLLRKKIGGASVLVTQSPDSTRSELSVFLSYYGHESRMTPTAVNTTHRRKVAAMLFVGTALCLGVAVWAASPGKVERPLPPRPPSPPQLIPVVAATEVPSPVARPARVNRVVPRSTVAPPFDSGTDPAEIAPRGTPARKSILKAPIRFSKWLFRRR